MSFLLQIKRGEVESHIDSAVAHHLDVAYAEWSKVQTYLSWQHDQINDLQAKLQALEARVNRPVYSPGPGYVAFN